MLDPMNTNEEFAPLPTVEGGFQTVLADPPWRFTNRTGKVAPEHHRLGRYGTMSLDEIKALRVSDVTADNAHLYLWVPNALLPEGLEVMQAWGFRYVSNIIWAKRRKDGGPDGRGVGFYFRNVTEPILFGVKGSMRTLAPGRSTVNMIETRKREHSRKPDEQYDLIEACSPGPYLELFARYARPGWSVWGNEASNEIEPRGKAQKGYGGGEIDRLPSGSQAELASSLPRSIPRAHLCRSLRINRGTQLRACAHCSHTVGYPFAGADALRKVRSHRRRVLERFRADRDGEQGAATSVAPFHTRQELLEVRGGRCRQHLLRFIRRHSMLEP